MYVESSAVLVFIQYCRSLLLISIPKEKTKYRIQFKSPCVLNIYLNMDSAAFVPENMFLKDTYNSTSDGEGGLGGQY
jgi:hypothetical protein